MLTERQERILRAIVELYISTARPVGSAALLSSAEFNVSSATVRNEMAILEEQGLIRQLHTSGGRVPTNDGYRYYVERLMHSSHLNELDAHTIRHQFHQAHSEVQEWLKLAATVIATRMHNVGLITAPRATEIRLRHVELISIQSTVALLILVLQDGTVLQEMIALDEPAGQDELGSQSARLNGEMQGRTVSEAERRLQALLGIDERVSEAVSHLLRRARERQTQVFHAGLADMLRQPEFLAEHRGTSLAPLNERLGRMVDFLQQGYAIERLIEFMPPSAQVQVVIGGDGTRDSLMDYSFVIGRYGDESDSQGFLGVIGPTRMEYPRAIALVRYMGELMTDLMQAY